VTLPNGAVVRQGYHATSLHRQVQGEAARRRPGQYRWHARISPPVPAKREPSSGYSAGKNPGHALRLNRSPNAQRQAQRQQDGG